MFIGLFFPFLSFLLSRFNDENEVIIEGRFPKDFKCEAIRWDLEDKIATIGNDVFPVGFKFETDVFYINESKTGRSIDVNKIPAENVFIKTPLFNKDGRNEMYFQYIGAVRYADVWKLVEPFEKVLFNYLFHFWYFVSEHRLYGI